MPDNGIRLADLPMDRREMVRDAIIFNIGEQCPLLNYINKVTVDDDADSIVFRRVLPGSIDKTSEAYKNGLAEGTNPTPSTLRKQAIKLPLQRWADTFEFTKTEFAHSSADIMQDTTKELSSRAVQYVSEKTADAFLSTTNRVTGITFSSEADFTNLMNIMLINNAKPIDGYYNLVVYPTLYTKIYATFHELLDHTSQREAPATGRIQYLFGFRLISLALDALKPTGTSYPFFAFGLNSANDYPVTGAAYGTGNGEIITKEFGTVRENDYTNQWGSISIEFAGTNYGVTDDSVLVAGTATVSGIAEPTKFDWGDSSNVVADNVSPSGIVLELTTLAVKDGSTQAFKAFKADGTLWTTGASVKTDDANVATAAFGSSDGIVTVTAKKPGVCNIIVYETADPTHAALCVATVLGPAAD